MDLPIQSRKADRVAEVIRQAIAAGRWQVKLPSERRLAQELDVSRPTIRTALEVLQVEGLLHRETGRAWRIDQARRGAVRPAKRRSIVVMLRNARKQPDMMSLYPLADSLRRKLHHVGHDLIIVDALAHGMQRLHEDLQAIDDEHHASFYILCSLSPEVHRWFEAKRLPSLILGSRTEDVSLPAIDTHPAATVAHAVDYFCRRGHRRIALLSPNVGGVGDSISMATFEERCSRHQNIQVQGKILNPTATPSAMKDAIVQHFTKPPHSTAVIAIGMEAAICLYTTLAQIGLSIPGDVSVVVESYWSILEFLSPRPSCYKSSWNRMSNIASRVIIDYINTGTLNDRFHNLIATLTEGESVRVIDDPATPTTSD